MFRYAYKVTYQKHLKGPDGSVSEVHVTYDPEVKGKPPKGVLSWVSCPSPGKEPAKAEVRLYAETVCSRAQISRIIRPDNVGAW
jgi:hypothetical protein